MKIRLDDGEEKPSISSTQAQDICQMLGAAAKSRFFFLPQSGQAIDAVFISTYADSVRQMGRNHFLKTIDMPSFSRLEAFGCSEKLLPEGVLSREILEEAIRPRVALVSLSWADPLTGVIQPLAELAEVCKEKDVRLHVDATAVLGKLFFRLEDFPIDFVSFSIDGGEGGLFVREGIEMPFFSSSGIERCVQNIQKRLSFFDHLCTETARLREKLETGILQGCPDAHILFSEKERLPHCSCISFPSIHHQALLSFLRQKGVYAKKGRDATSLSFILSHETREEHIDHAVQCVVACIKELPMAFKHMGLLTVEEAKALDYRLVIGKEEALSFYLLIDERDGMIVKAAFQIFGPLEFIQAAESASILLEGKNYDQARRISWELIEKRMHKEYGLAQDISAHLNTILGAIENAALQCMDIPFADSYIVTPIFSDEERKEYPGWQDLSTKEKLDVIEEVIAKEIRPYVELDAGGVNVINLIENEVFIAYQGSCTSCYSATGSTLTAIQQILQTKVYSQLTVTPEFPTS